MARPDHGGTLSPAGEPLHRLPPPRPAPDLVEPIRLRLQARRARPCRSAVFGQLRTRHGGADAETTLGGFLDCTHLGDFLDVDDQAGRTAPERICTRRSVPPAMMRAALRRRQSADRFLQRTRAQILDIRHGCYRRLPCPPPFVIAGSLARPADRKSTRAKTIGQPPGSCPSGMLPCVERACVAAMVSRANRSFWPLWPGMTLGLQ